MNITTLTPGTVVANPRGFFNHVGILSEFGLDGDRRVISASAEHGQVVEQKLHVFAPNNKIINLGFPGKLAPDVVLARARAKLGTEYQLFKWNCDHLVQYAHDLQIKSDQVRFWACLAVAIGAIFLIGGRGARS